MYNALLKTPIQSIRRLGMANAEIEISHIGKLDLVNELYNAVFLPPKAIDFFQRRFKGREGATTILAYLDDKPVGFSMGFELKPSTYFAWLCGVLPDARRMGVASQLMEALHNWAGQNGYRTVRFECYSKHRPILHFAIKSGYDIVGIRWDPDGHDNLVIFEKNVEEHHYEEG